jgi:CRISPR-associated protein Cmr4
MYQTSQPLFLCCETPLHAGSGNDMGLIDMPIQRESNTGFPKVESSSLKGSLRQAFESSSNRDAESIHRVFGFDADGLDGKELKAKLENTQYAGCLALTDARILLVPVKSPKGVYTWVSCPRVINRFVRDINQLAGMSNYFSFSSISPNTISDKSELVKDKSVQLENFEFSGIQPNAQVAELAEKLALILYPSDHETYWAEHLKQYLVVLSDEDFSDFVNYSTEVITRNKIDNTTGAASDTGLFTEEYLPCESVMYSLALFSPEFSARVDKMSAEQVKTYFVDNKPAYFQLGANASLGKGIIKLKTI